MTQPAVEQPSVVTVDECKDLRRTACRVRMEILKTLHHVGSGHSGPSLSIVEMLVALYFVEMRTRPDEPEWADRDRFVLSKGHGALGLYAVLAEAGYFPKEELSTFESLGSRLQGHPDCQLTPGVEMSTGSLGQGLSVSMGHALAARKMGSEVRAFCLLGDGECQEGNVWEAAMGAAKFKLGNLVSMIDRNRLQGGITSEVMPSLEPLADKWTAFGWKVIDIDGHDFGDLLMAFDSARGSLHKPTVIIANTVKGKGVSYMENDPDWHSGKVGDTEFEIARGEIEAQLAAIDEETS